MSARRSSNVWYHFTEKEASRAQCRYCNGLISTAGGSLGNLRRHLKNKHPTIPEQRSGSEPSEPSASSSSTRSSLRSRSPSLLVEESGSVCSTPSHTYSESSHSSAVDVRPQHKSRPLQSSLREFIEVIKPVSLNKSKEIDLQLLRMICKEYHPFSLVDDTEFKKFVALLCPGYKLPSRKTLSKSLLPQMYTDLLGQVKTKLADAVAVSLTTDSWTSINNQSFMAITVHFINSNSVLCSNLLGCFEFTERHTSINLAAMLRSQCKEWNIESKLMAIVTDNAANVTAAANEVSNHIGCYAHTLNLIVKSAIIPISEIIEKGKAIVSHFKKSSHALAKLHEVQRQMNLPELKLIQDVPTRWNSTFEMLKRLFANREPIISTLALLRYGEETLTETEWEIIEQLIPLLEVFDDITKELSAEKAVTLSKAMVLSRNLYDFVYDASKKHSIPDSLKQVCEKLLSEINDRLTSKEHDLVPESALLDPRFKKSAFKNTIKYDAIYESLVTKVQALHAKEKKGALSDKIEVSSTQDTSNPSKIWAKFDRETMALTAKQNPRAASIVEVDKYLAEPLLPRLSDPLIWWEHRKSVYPNLYKVAMRRLCIPASSVPCERTFSKAGQIMTEKRNRMLTSKLSQIIFIQHNS